MDMKIAALVLALFALVACTQSTTTGQVAQPVNGEIAPAPANADMPSTKVGTAPAGDTVAVSMSATNFQFTPGEIHVKKGQTVKLTVTGTEGDHGIAIEGYGNHVEFNQGETKTLEFTADKAGTFAFYCNVPCGPGHRTMRGKLIVDA